jgi:hypothetical protein
MFNRQNKERPMSQRFAFSLGLGVLFVASTVQAQMAVKCTSAEGDVTYSDTPCLRTEKTAVVDTRAATNVLDYSSIRSQKERVWTPVAAAPVYSAPPAQPAPPPAPFVVDRTVKSAVQSARSY